jgi:hypothetical protein
MLSIHDCYRLLQLRSDATQDDIKRAFRNKAKLLHPDRNTSSDAHEQFILLHEAYEKLQKHRPDPRRRHPAMTEEERMERSRKAAENYAKMKYREYIRETEMYHQSPYAWIFRILYYGLFLIYLFCALLFAFIPLGLIQYGIGWFFLSSPLWILSYVTFVYAYDWKKEIDPLFE